MPPDDVTQSTEVRLSRQVRALQRRVAELEVQGRWRLDRIRELEASIALGGAADRTARSAPAAESIAQQDTGAEGGTGDHPERAALQETLATRRLELQVASLDAALRQKELVIEELAATAEQRLDLLTQGTAEAARLREAIHRQTADLYDRDALIAELTATADERLHHLEDASAEAELLRSAIQQQTGELHQKEQMIAELAATAEERLRVIELLDAAIARGPGAPCRLARELAEKERAIEGLKATADERLRLIERLEEEAVRARHELDTLTQAVHGRARR